MFYSSEILNIKSNANLGIVWLAATLGPKSNAKRLARKELTSINVPDTCAFLLAPPEPLSLRLSANLMIGVSRVYGQQCQYHYGDVQGLCTKLSHVNTPANPDAINLANHEKKGINISLKKIDCISAVNTLPGDPLNFPDLDIANLLLDTATTVSNGRSSLSSNLSVEIGRKSMLIGTPFSTSSSNALQGSDFAAVISDSDFGSLNDHDDMPYSEDFSLALRPAFKDRITSDNLTFQVPDLLARQKRRLKRFKNALMDHELMLEKDQLFINQQGMLNYSGAELLSNISDPIMEALKLLNGPEYIFIPGTFDSIFTSNRLKFSYAKKKPIIAGLVVNDDNQYPPDSDNGNYHDDFNDIEAYRNDANSISSSTPSNFVLPWSTSSSFSSSHSTFLDKHGGVSSILNTPIRKGGNNTPSPLTDLTDLKLSSSSSSTSFSSTSSAIFGNNQTSSMSQETFDFFYYLVDSITSKSGSLSSILKREYTSRPIAARALHHLLELRSANLIEVEQNCPFADIKISIIQ